MIDFTYRSDLDAVVFNAVGTFTLGLYLEAMNGFMASDFFRPGLASLWDCREVDAGAVTSDEIMAIAEYNKTLSPDRGTTWKAAILVSEELAFGLSRVFASYAESAPNEVKLFRELEAAEEWIRSG